MKAYLHVHVPVLSYKMFSGVWYKMAVFKEPASH